MLARTLGRAHLSSCRLGRRAGAGAGRRGRQVLQSSPRKVNSTGGSLAQPHAPRVLGRGSPTHLEPLCPGQPGSPVTECRSSSSWRQASSWLCDSPLNVPQPGTFLVPASLNMDLRSGSPPGSGSLMLKPPSPALSQLSCRPGFYTCWTHHSGSRNPLLFWGGAELTIHPSPLPPDPTLTPALHRSNLSILHETFPQAVPASVRRAAPSPAFPPSS